MAESVAPLSERDEYERGVLALVVKMPRRTLADRLARLNAYYSAMWQWDVLSSH